MSSGWLGVAAALLSMSCSQSLDLGHGVSAGACTPWCGDCSTCADARCEPSPEGVDCPNGVCSMGVCRSPHCRPPASGYVVGLGNQSSCAVRDGRLWCWGRNTERELAMDLDARTTPGHVDTSNAWARVSVGRAHACGVQMDGTMWCWGANDRGQLGQGDTMSRRDPARTLVPGGGPWSSVACGGDHCCALAADALYCFGETTRGVLGIGATTSANETLPAHVGSGWTSIATGPMHACGIRSDGMMLCWGANDQGQLGTGTTADSPQPVAVASSGSWSKIAAGGAHTCAVATDGAVWCWGANDAGQLGLSGIGASQAAPERIDALAAIADVAAGERHTCARATAGTLWCWGSGVSQPTEPIAGATWLTIAAGARHSCAAREGALSCWGDNDWGQLGVGDTMARAVPEPLCFSDP